MKLVISSKNENVITFNSQTFYLNNSFTSVDINESTFFCVYPINQAELVPFAFYVKKENDFFSCRCEQVKSILFKNYLEIEILPFKVINKLPILINEAFNEKKIHVKIFDSETNNLVIKNGQNIFNDSLEGFEESSINFIENYIIINYKNKKNYYIYIYGILENKSLLHCEIEQFELNTASKSITILQKLNDCLFHGKIIEISLNENFSVVNTSLTYLKEINNDVCKEIAIFDCAKAGNFKKLQEFITPELRVVLTKENVGAYFHDFNEIVQSKIDFNFYLLTKNKHQIATPIEFEYKDNLINNLKILYNFEKKDNN